MFEKNWSWYLIEQIWVAIIILRIIFQLFKRKNIFMKFFLIIEIILVPNLFWYIMSTLKYFYIYVFFIWSQAHNFFALLYTYIWTKSGHSTDTHRHQQIPADTFRCLTDTHLFIFLYIWWHTILYRLSIYTYRQTNSGQYNVPPVAFQFKSYFYLLGKKSWWRYCINSNKPSKA